MRPAKSEDLTRTRRAPLSLAVALSLYSMAGLAAEPRCADWAAQLVSVEGSVSWRASDTADWQSAQLHDYFCQGDLLRVERSRAALRLNNETVVRLSEHSQLKLQPQAQSFWVELKQGAAHFLSRTPRDFTVSAPYVNASVDGTEFLVAHQSEGDTVTVVEGQVTASNSYGQVSLTQFEQATAAPGSAPQKRLEIQLSDAVSWTLHYPQLISLQRGAPADIAQLIANGEIDAARTRLEALPTLAGSAPLQNLLTSLNLYSGRVDAARAANQSALQLDPNSPDALALRAMMTLAEGERDQAATQTRALTERFADNPSVWLVHSYVLQAQFELEDAFDAASRAVQLAPADSALWLRRAELALNLDRTRVAKRALAEAAKLSPGNAEAELLHGILDLKQRRFSRAHQRFAAVVQADSGHALGQFMLGLTDIRLGKLQTGRERLELAALLDPNNSLYRSYLGKAYFEEHRFPLADVQYDLAKTLDPNDPTPYFYSALQQQYLNRPHLAFEQIELAVAKNDNRALFRSRLQLDADEAARVASQAEIYRDIGLEERAQFLAGQAIAAAPGAHSGHRMMAESLIDDSLADGARASEMLQAQYTQPLSKTPIRSELSERSKFSIDSIGLTGLGSTDFDSIFDRSGINLELAYADGANQTRMRDIYLSGLKGKVAVGADWYDYKNSGFTENNSVDYENSALYLNYQPTSRVSLHLETKKREENRENLTPQLSSTTSPFILIYTNDATYSRAGIAISGSRVTYLTSIALIETDETQETVDDGPVLFVNDQSSSDKTKEIQSQAILNADHFNMIAGGSYAKMERERLQIVTINGEMLNGRPFLDLAETIEDADVYNYLYLKPGARLSALIGGKYHWYKEHEGFEPKLAISYRPIESVSITAAAFDSARRQLEIEQNLEPTHLFGIVQHQDKPTFSHTESHVLSAKYTHRNRIYLGAEYRSQETHVPIDQSDLYRHWDEDFFDVYGLILFDSFSLKISHKRTRFENTNRAGLPNNSNPYITEWEQTPLELRYFSNGGLTARLIGTYYEQNLASTVGYTTPPQSYYSTVDLNINYSWAMANGARLVASASIMNIGDEKIELNFPGYWLDPTPKLWNVAPERYGLLEIALRF